MIITLICQGHKVRIKRISNWPVGQMRQDRPRSHQLRKGKKISLYVTIRHVTQSSLTPVEKNNLTLKNFRGICLCHSESPIANLLTLFN